MGFLARATACPQMTEERKGVLGRAMDLNALHWLITTMTDHLDRKWLERRIGLTTQVRPQAHLVADKEMEARTMLEELEAEEENKWWRGFPEEHRRGHWRDDREGVPGQYADAAESEEEEEEEDEMEMEEGDEQVRGEPPEEFRDLDSDMEWDFFDPPDWPPIGTVYMALDVTLREEEATPGTRGMKLREEVRGRPTQTREEPGQREIAPIWDIGELSKRKGPALAWMM
ncbi:unnamed protein product [Closterium sp. NIES-54]